MGTCNSKDAVQISPSSKARLNHPPKDNYWGQQPSMPNKPNNSNFIGFRTPIFDSQAQYNGQEARPRKPSNFDFLEIQKGQFSLLGSPVTNTKVTHNF